MSAIPSATSGAVAPPPFDGTATDPVGQRSEQEHGGSANDGGSGGDASTPSDLGKWMPNWADSACTEGQIHDSLNKTSANSNQTATPAKGAAKEDSSAQAAHTAATASEGTEKHDESIKVIAAISNLEPAKAIAKKSEYKPES